MTTNSHANSQDTTVMDSPTVEKIHPKYMCPCSSLSEGRNLVVCIDGTSNQYGIKVSQNTNIIELYSRLFGDKRQLLYYNSGIGTYARPSWRSLHFYKQVLENKIDLAIALNFETIIKTAYRWLCDQYQEGDRIYLFGFSRGAYQVRVLAAMIEKVGLIHCGNKEQIPFAYELYAGLDPHVGQNKSGTFSSPKRFKATFSRKNVRVHFVGVWDTVSSIGLVRGKNLPLVDSCEHICFFRHALALDECRVKFIPECIARVGDGEKNHMANDRVKEVWFPGSHSDVGGGNQANTELNLESSPLLWMQNEAFLAGLRFRRSRLAPDYDYQHKRTTPYESLTGTWWLLEWLPLRRASRADPRKITRAPHYGKGRSILPGQKIHASLAFQPAGYRPKADFVHLTNPMSWTGIVHREFDGVFRPKWAPLLERDIFDLEAVPALIELLAQEDKEGSLHILDRLSFLSDYPRAQAAFYKMPRIFEVLKRYAAAENTVAALAALQILTPLVFQELKVPELSPDMPAIDIITQLPVHRDMSVNSAAIKPYVEIAQNDLYRIKLVHSGGLLKLMKVLDDRNDRDAARALEELAKRGDSRSAVMNFDVAPILIKIIKSGGVDSPTMLKALVEITRLQDEESRGLVHKMIRGSVDNIDSETNSRILTAIAEHDISRPEILHFLPNLIRELEKNCSFVSTTLVELARHDDSRLSLLQFQDSLITPVYKLWYASDGAVEILLEIIKHDDSRQVTTNMIPRFLQNTEVPGVLRILEALVQYDDSRRVLLKLESKYDILKNLYHHGAIDVLIELARHDDSRYTVIRMIPQLVTYLGTSGAIWQRYFVHLKIISELIEHDDSRCALIEERGTAHHLNMCLSTEHSLFEAVSNVLCRLTLYVPNHNFLSASETKLGLSVFAKKGPDRIYASLLLAEFLQYDDSREALLSSGTIDMFIKTFGESGKLGNDFEFRAMTEMTVHENTRALIIEILPKLARMLRGQYSEKVGEVLARLAEYEDSRAEVLRLIPKLLEHLEDLDIGSIPVLGQLAKHEDSQRVIQNEAIPVLDTVISKNPKNRHTSILQELKKNLEGLG